MAGACGRNRRFQKSVSREPDALIYENDPVEGSALRGSKPNQPSLTNSNSDSAGTGIWNAAASSLGGVVSNRQEDGTTFTEADVKAAVETVGPVRYYSGVPGTMGEITDCAGFVDQVVDELDGTASPLDDSGDGKSIPDWLREVPEQ